ncbi:MAG: hypothetical protein A2912_02525 [Candidatus Buchananbacteria bacterium RIFCSPLOWO2_01_FULL_40_23b]|uniref:Glycerol-3-phosphate dehydrogenase (NAD(P)(+)) n=1 Tax=Candidatus Buchananbacteria bacterium RIFCSPLOWO2_01_FULL_40_23b TaxID=1797544 RepID=A0A1G1YSH7_9BACT|nr:MAG: hypothetical protein A2912_02525 [Candidatus Buchananbacteria bacterium RIFCSPLOWO2_01_FULL_40_23b]
MVKQVTIIGAGAIGKAIGKTLSENQETKIHFWDVVKNKVRNQRPLADIVPTADFLFLCLPSFATPAAIKNIKPFLKKETIVISVSKGIDKKSKKFISQILKESLPASQNFALLYGPMLASELMRNQGGVAVAATTKKSAFEKIKKIFSHSGLLVSYSSDVVGVGALGVLKNVYAISLGIADGLGWQNNRKGFLTAKILEEIFRLLPLLGGRAQTTLTPAGVGDLIATGFCPTSHNQQLGRQLALRLAGSKESEGYYSLPPLAQKLDKRIKNFPLLSTIYQVVIKNQDAKIAFSRLIKN